jgi:hypothetical protein
MRIKIKLARLFLLGLYTNAIVIRNCFVNCEVARKNSRDFPLKHLEKEMRKRTKQFVTIVSKYMNLAIFFKGRSLKAFH